MRTIILLLALLGLFVTPGYAGGDGGHDGGPGLRARVVNQARQLVSIREQGRNAGPEVSPLIREAGGRVGDAWCSWAMVWVLRRAGVLVPRFGAARSWFDRAHTVWRGGVTVAARPAPQPGDLLGYTWGQPAICHVEMLIAWGKGPSCRAIGGNTGGGGALQREGEGGYENWRLKRMVAAVANVVDNPRYAK